MLVRALKASGGGGTPTLLWQNNGTSVPSSPITLANLSSYTHLLFKFNSGDGNVELWGMGKISNGGGYMIGAFLSGDIYATARQFTISGNTITFEPSTSYEARMNSSGQWTNNSYAIPLEIYGVSIS